MASIKQIFNTVKETVKAGVQTAAPFVRNKINDIKEQRKKVSDFLSPESPEEAIGQGMLPIKQKDGSYRYADITGSGTIRNVTNKAVVNPVKKLVAKVTEKFAEKSQGVRTQLIDRFAPLQDFVKNANIDVDVNPYVAARNFAGRFGKIQNRLDKLSDILTPAREDLPMAKEYGLLERFEELAGRGISKFPGGLTRESIPAKKLELETKLGAKLPQIKGFLDNLRGYTNELLTEAKDAGIISDEAFESIFKNNEKYLPLQRMEYLEEQLDNLPRGSKSFSVATQNIIKSIKGSEKEIADPIESIVRNTYKTVNLIERNKVAQKIANLSNLPEFKDLVVKIEKDVPAGFDKLSVFKNGVKEEYAIPKEIADAVKGLNEANIDIVTRTAGFLGGLLRAGATSLNIGFLPANAIRDFQTASVASKVGFTPWDWLKGFAEAVKRGRDYDKFLESGGSFSGYFQQNQKLSTTVKQLTEPKALTIAKTIANPVKLLQTIGETIELAPRLGVFKRSLTKGLSDTEAAFNARNATVDFAKAGSVMKVANLWIPFLNARTQGTLNLLNAVKERPIRSAVVIGSIVQVPTVASYFHNTKFHQDIWNDIAQYEKDNNFLLVYGDDRDEEGNPTQVIKIPKGDVGKIFANPLENFLAYLHDADAKGFEQVITEVFSAVSPIDVAKDGKLSGQTALSGVLPPTIKAGVETVTNQNLFTGRNIVPRSLEGASPELQYTDGTSPIAIKLGQFLGISPAKLENFVGTQFGGLGRQVLNPATAATQVGSRFSGARGGEQQQKDFEAVDQLQQEDTDRKVIARRKAVALFEEIKELSPERRQERVQDLMQRGEFDATVIEKLGEHITEQAKGLDDFDRVLKSQPNAVKAKFLVDKLTQLPIEERRKYFEDLAGKGLVTEQLIEEITAEIKRRAQSPRR